MKIMMIDALTCSEEELVTLLRSGEQGGLFMAQVCCRENLSHEFMVEFHERLPHIVWWKQLHDVRTTEACSGSFDRRSWILISGHQKMDAAFIEKRWQSLYMSSVLEHSETPFEVLQKLPIHCWGLGLEEAGLKIGLSQLQKWGACEYGVKRFVERRGPVNKTYTFQELLNLLEDRSDLSWLLGKLLKRGIRRVKKESAERKD